MISMKKVKKLLEKRAIWNKKHIPVPLINWVAPAAVGVKQMFKPSIKNKLIDIDYEDKNVKIAHYYNKKDEHGYPMHNGFTYVYVFDGYEDKWVVHGVLEFEFESSAWWLYSDFYGTHSFDSYESIAKWWAENRFLPPREFVSKKDKERMEMDSLINSHICEMSEGMMSLSHTGV